MILANVGERARIVVSVIVEVGGGDEGGGVIVELSTIYVECPSPILTFESL